MRRSLPAFALLLLVAGACQRRSSVEGDVFLLMSSGDKKEGAGIEAYLLQDIPTLAAQVGTLCSTSAAQVVGQRDTLEIVSRGLGTWDS
jgi:hypothetical protein